MKVTEVYFKRNYAISPLTMEHMHLSATVQVEDGERPADALTLAQKIVEDFYADACKQSSASEYMPSTPLFDMNIDKPKSTMIDEMNACTDEKSILSFKLAIKNAEQKEVYETKLQSLKNNF